jgi:hypothetical protein
MNIRESINVPTIPVRAWRIAELNGMPEHEANSLLYRLEKAGKVKSEALPAGGGLYWYATETPKDGWNQATVEIPRD